MMGTTLMSVLAVVYDGRREALTASLNQQRVEYTQQMEVDYLILLTHRYSEQS